MSEYPQINLRNSIATKLLSYVFSIYLVVSIVVTGIHMVSEYRRVEHNVIEDIKIFHLNSNPIMGVALWEADKEQMTSILNGFVKSPTILGIKISDLSGRYVRTIGKSIDPKDELRLPEKGEQSVLIKENGSDLFGYQFPIVYSRETENHKMGTMILYSSPSVIFSRVQYSYLFIVINAIIKTIVLWVVFLWFSRFLLHRPLSILTSAAKEIELENLEKIRINIKSSGRNELTILADTFNDMIQKLLRARSDLYKNNEHLEIRVSERTTELSEAYIKLKQEEEALKASESKLKQAKQKAEKANRTKSEFLANMSHELRTPLNAILGFSELMTRDSNISTEQLNNLQTIGRSGEHLLSLINDVLEFSKIEAGRIVLHKENFDLHRLLLGLEEMFQLRAQQKGLSLNFEQGTDVPQYIRADQNKLRQILINLVGNAVKFTETGGVILSATKNYPDNQTQTDSCFLTFNVADTGMGIPNEEQGKVFEAFFQSGDLHSKQDGTGLGLPISKKFTELMGGTLGVKSEAGKGTQFTFSIPVELTYSADEASLQQACRIIGLAPGQPTFRLLVVEDDENSRDLLVKLLRNVDFEVKEAVNGREAIEVWQKWQPQLIWMDIHMPFMDGNEATKIIKSEMRNSKSEIDTKIIAITARAFEEDRLKIVEHGGDDFVRKPFREFEIFEMMQKHLGIKYIYEEDYGGGLKTVVPSEKISEDSLTASIRDLSREIIARLIEATELSDAAMIEQVIKDIRTENVQLANALSDLADNFAYDDILKLIYKA